MEVKCDEGCLFPICASHQLHGPAELWVAAALKSLTILHVSYLVCIGLVSLPEVDRSQESCHEHLGVKAIFTENNFYKS